MSDEPDVPTEDVPVTPPAMGGLFTLTATAEVIRGDQNEDPEETR